MKLCRRKAANEAKKFVKDGATILTHGHSRAVVEVLRVSFLQQIQGVKSFRCPSPTKPLPVSHL